MSGRVRVQRIAVLVLWMLLLTLWSNQASLPIDDPQIKSLFFNMQHRVAHLISFGLLGLLAWWAFDGFPRARLSALILVALFGATDEIHQAFVPGRKAGLDDWLFDIFAAALALYIWPKLQNSRWPVRAVAPLVVVAVFTVAVVLLARPLLVTLL